METEKLQVDAETAQWVLSIMKPQDQIVFISDLLALYLQGKEPVTFNVEFKRKKAKT